MALIGITITVPPLYAGQPLFGTPTEYVWLLHGWNFLEYQPGQTFYAEPHLKAAILARNLPVSWSVSA